MLTFWKTLLELKKGTHTHIHMLGRLIWVGGHSRRNQKSTTTFHCSESEISRRLGTIIKLLQLHLRSTDIGFKITLETFNG